MVANAIASPADSTDVHELGERVLILVPTPVDAEIAFRVLADAGLTPDIVPDASALTSEIGRGAGAVLIAAEVLTPGTLGQLQEFLSQQPPWSELPVLIFVDQPGDMRPYGFDLLGPRAHVTLVDRPIHLATLVSATVSALRSRQRQYELRDLVARLEMQMLREREHAERLNGLAQASVSIASAVSLDDVLRMLTEQAQRLLSTRFAVTRAVSDPRANAIVAVASTGEKQWEEMFNAPTEELMQMLTAPVRLSAADLHKSRFLEILRQQIGEVVPRNAMGAPLLEPDHEPLGFIALFDKDEGDFTESDESVLVQLAQMASVAVQKARLFREAQEANRAKDDFLATLAHELRTPMTAILGWVQLLRDGELDGVDVGNAIRMIEASTKVQAHLVEDLLDVSRIIAGKLKIQATAIELRPLLQNVTETFAKTAQENGVKLIPDLHDDPMSVWGDATRLQQVIWNLLSNAIKFTPKGGSVTLSLTRDDGYACIGVRDTGEGISPEFLPFVFERFRQAERGTMRTHSGLGLGLAIVRHLVTMHGGEVAARSDGPGNGAEFIVRLPLKAVREDDVPASDELPDLQNCRILVVDDDEKAREALRALLEARGAEVETVGSVGAALSSLRNHEADLIVSDIAMPGEDGYALMRRLREVPVGENIPTLAVTGYGREEDQLRILSAGFRRYVQKPVSGKELVTAAAELLAR
jgi:signal transduction histidine kinase